MDLQMVIKEATHQDVNVNAHGWRDSVLRYLPPNQTLDKKTMTKEQQHEAADKIMRDFVITKYLDK